MDGFGAALERAIVGMVLVALVVGAVLTLAIERVASWLLRHLVIGWQ